MDIILNRRSVRKYDLTKKVTYEDMLDLCKYGEAAPSARRQKGREYIIIDDLSIISKLSTISKGALILQNCESCIAVIGRNPETLVTPDMQPQDLSAATQNILLMATELGLGACWNGIHPQINVVERIRKILELDENVVPLSLIHIGYMDEEKNPNSGFDENRVFYFK